ncbi:MAG TPA: TIGR02757 family protein [Kiritimatiellia bacterium]|nr:TIGR02757 family protein [Kiritimatiellia bacterium]
MSGRRGVGRMNRAELAEGLEALYQTYNHTRFRSTDPVEFIYRYEKPNDREIAGMFSALLAYGQVQSIRASVEKALWRLGQSPAEGLQEVSDRELAKRFEDFRHRWTGPGEVVDMLRGVKAVQREYGSLGGAFALVGEPEGEGGRMALARWVGLLKQGKEFTRRDLLSDPWKNSACKRLHLFLRWMVRKDEIDAGVWEGIPCSVLWVPVDVHMHRIAGWLGWTRRRVADARTVEEITAAFRRVRPEDPARYDFALTRLGMEGVANREDLFQRLRNGCSSSGVSSTLHA